MKENETVICPKCKKPFPKKRLELGYRFCINCSSQGTVHPIIESIGQGEEAETVMHIVSHQEFVSIQRGQRMLHKSLYENPDTMEIEEAPDMSTLEDQDEQFAHLSPADREAQLEAIENEQAGLSERTLEDLQEAAPLLEETVEEEEDY